MHTACHVLCPVVQTFNTQSMFNFYCSRYNCNFGKFCNFQFAMDGIFLLKRNAGYTCIKEKKL